MYIYIYIYIYIHYILYPALNPALVLDYTKEDGHVYHTVGNRFNRKQLAPMVMRIQEMQLSLFDELIKIRIHCVEKF